MVLGTIPRMTVSDCVARKQGKRGGKEEIQTPSKLHPL